MAEIEKQEFSFPDEVEKKPEAEDDGAEEAYATHMEVDQEDQSHSDEEDDDSYE